MTIASISVTRALSELKALDLKIGNPSLFGTLTGVAVAGKTVQSASGELPQGESDAKSKILSNIQKMEAALERRRALKAKIVDSNAKTFVKVGDKYITVAEAIELKSRVESLEGLVLYVKSQVVNTNTVVSRLEATMEQMIAAQVQTLLGSDSDKAEVEKTIENITAPIKKQKQPTALTENANAFIEKAQAEIETMKTEIDFVLSESNAITTITV